MHLISGHSEHARSDASRLDSSKVKKARPRAEPVLVRSAPIVATSAAVRLPQSISKRSASAGQIEFARDMKIALAGRPHAISPKYLYDREGSRLFDRICELPEYYPSRVECSIVQECARAIGALAGPRAEIVEFGAGSLQKVRFLLEAFDDPVSYLPIDISGDHLRNAAIELRSEFKKVEVQPIVADYSQPFVLPPLIGERRIGFFPGSTLGNFTGDEALDFLQRSAELLRGGALVVGVDLVKDPRVLHAAYNDSQGVTAAFNLNLLDRSNREIGSNFVLDRFAHYAFYNAPLHRIEMHLVSRAQQSVALDGQSFTLQEGESLHTENSYKFTVSGLRALAARAGFRPGPVWTDPDRLFSVHWLEAPGS